MAMKQDIPGHIMFDGDQAQKGVALNRRCFSFNAPENRAASLEDEEAYGRKYALTEAQRAAVKSRNILALLEAGGNVYYLAKLAGIFGLNVQDLGAQQTGMSVDAFKAKLAAAGRGTWPGSSVRSHRPPCPRSARRSPRRERTIPTGDRSFPASTTSMAGSPARSRTWRSCSTTTTASTSFSTSCRLLRSARRASTATRTRAGAFRCRVRSPATRRCRGT